LPLPVQENFFHRIVSSSSVRHRPGEKIQSVNEAEWKLLPHRLSEWFEVSSLETLAIDKAVSPQQAGSDPGQMKRGNVACRNLRARVETRPV